MSCACTLMPPALGKLQEAPETEGDRLYGGKVMLLLDEMPLSSQLKVLSIRQQIHQGTYDLDRRLDIVLEGVFRENGGFL